MYGDEDENDFDGDDSHDFEDDEAEEGDEFETGADLTCPFCGEAVSITLDPGSGAEQEYVEDCEVCCRPMHIMVHYDDAGAAVVTVDQG